MLNVNNVFLKNTFGTNTLICVISITTDCSFVNLML